MKKQRIFKRHKLIKLNCDNIDDPEFSRKPKEGYGFIYRYTFGNGKQYIGQTIQTVKARTKNHRYCKTKVDDVIRSGARFTIEILTETKIEYLNDAEVFCIARFNTLIPNGYNMSEGGTERIKYADEVIEANRKRSKEYWNRPENKAKLLERHKLAMEATPKRPVICLETGKCYERCSDAVKEYGGKDFGILAVFRGEQYRWKRLHWMPYSKYVAENTEEVLKVFLEWEKESRKVNRTQRPRDISTYDSSRIPVMCLETGKLFSSSIEASKAFGFKKSVITDVITGRSFTATEHRFHFIKYEDWMYGSEKEILSCLKDWEETMRQFNQRRKNDGYYRKAIKVLCLETGKVYGSYNQAMRDIPGLSIANIKQCVEGRYTVAKGYHWILYREEYLNIKNEIIDILDEWGSVRRDVSLKTSARQMACT